MNNNTKSYIWKNNKINLNDDEWNLMNCSENDEEELINFFKIIKKRNWMKYDRLQENSDGIFGNIFEDLIGIKENNDKNSDYGEFEIKTKKNDSNSLITLFNKSINSFNGANTDIRRIYGVPCEGNDGMNIFNSTISSNEWNTHRGGFNFKLKCDKEKIWLKIQNNLSKDIVDNNKYYWFKKEIANAVNKKIKNCCLIQGEIDKGSGVVKFNKMEIFKEFDINSFFDLLENGSIKIDFRIGIYKTGKNQGKTHDHGTAFRIKKENLNKLFKHYKCI